jgi:hypothetical protein
MVTVKLIGAVIVAAIHGVGVPVKYLLNVLSTLGSAKSEIRNEMYCKWCQYA